MTKPRPLPDPPVHHQGSRSVPYQPNLARVIAGLRRQLRDLSMRQLQSLLPVPAGVTAGAACTAAAMTSIFKMWTYRVGGGIYVDADIGCGTGSVVAAQLYCPDLGVTGAAVETAAGGEQVMRLTLQFPTSWNPGDTHWVYVQAYRVSGTDSTTIQVARAWQR